MSVSNRLGALFDVILVTDVIESMLRGCSFGENVSSGKFSTNGVCSFRLKLKLVLNLGLCMN
jgi:hypothetical protein